MLAVKMAGMVAELLELEAHQTSSLTLAVALQIFELAELPCLIEKPSEAVEVEQVEKIVQHNLVVEGATPVAWAAREDQIKRVLMVALMVAE